MTVNFIMQLNVQATGDKKAKAKLTLRPYPHFPEVGWGWEVWGSQALPVTVSSTGLDLERALQQFLSLKDKLFIYNIKQTVIKTGS